MSGDTQQTGHTDLAISSAQNTQSASVSHATSASSLSKAVKKRTVSRHRPLLSDNPFCSCTIQNIRWHSSETVQRYEVSAPTSSVQHYVPYSSPPTHTARVKTYQNSSGGALPRSRDLQNSNNSISSQHAMLLNLQQFLGQDARRAHLRGMRHPHTMESSKDHFLRLG